MTRRRPRGLRAFRPGIEPLDARRVPAQFGVPWHDPEHLSISFVPDGTRVSGDRSNLFGLLDAAQPTAVWQGQILGAFRAWAAAAGVNFSAVADGGQPLGSPGPDQGDPRFGDIRIGARPMSSGVLSISVPHDPFLSGTWSGDILLNSNVAFGRGVDLVPVILHEVGHVLGLDESDDPRSVMFGRLDNTKTALSEGDVAAAQALYGPPVSDPFEGPGGNDRLDTATPFPLPAGFDGSTPLLLYADIAAPDDADVFAVGVPAGYEGPMTVRVQTDGVSLLAPRLTVLDASGGVLADVSAEGETGGTLRFTLPRVEAGATFRVVVRAAAADVLGLGKYALAVSFDARSLTDQDAIDTLARQSYDYLSADDLRAIFVDPEGALFGDDHRGNETFAGATALRSIGKYGSEAPYRVTASLGDRGDVDVYRIETPENSDDHNLKASSEQPLVMTVTVRDADVNGIVPVVSVFDAARRPVPAVVLARGAGAFTIQVQGARPDSIYYLRVAHDPRAVKVAGNYELDVEFGHQAATPVDFVAATLDAEHRQADYVLAVGQSQLFDFLLSARAAGAAPGASVQLTITDARGRLVATRSAAGGETDGGDSLLLQPGLYLATFRIEADGAGPPPTMNFRLYGASLSNPIGPALDDPTLAPASDVSGIPILGSSDAPYAWLSRTLAARPEPAPLSAEAVDGTAPAAPALARTVPTANPASALGAVANATSTPPAVPLAGLPGAVGPPAGIPSRPPAQALDRPFAVLARPGRGSEGPPQDLVAGVVELGAGPPAEAVGVAGPIRREPWWSVTRLALRSPAAAPVQVSPADRVSIQAGPPAPDDSRAGAPAHWTAAAIGFGPHAAAVFCAAAVGYNHARRHRSADRRGPITLRSPIMRRSWP